MAEGALGGLSDNCPTWHLLGALVGTRVTHHMAGSAAEPSVWGHKVLKGHCQSLGGLCSYKETIKADVSFRGQDRLRGVQSSEGR